MVSISTGKDSKQDYQTPPEFIAAVEKRFGKIVFDLAAGALNRQADRYYSVVEDSLKQDWAALAKELRTTTNKPALLWLNPPFNRIEPWAEKCAKEARLDPEFYHLGNKIAFLVPASVGSQWFRIWVEGNADTYFCTGRLSFDGKSPFPKDCMLCIFPFQGDWPTIETWDWRCQFCPAPPCKHHKS